MKARRDMLPNTLVLGAAKAGTTSLYRYLSQHPQIYMSPKKEPGFFAYEGCRPRFRGPGDDKLNRSLVTALDDYRELFREGRHHPVRGEASVFYLYTPGTAERIRSYVPDARLLVLLRNPVERAYSAYLHLRRDGREPISSFPRALAVERQRIREGWQHMWHYRAVSRYAEQVERFLDLFPRRQILFLVFERFVRDPRAHLERTFEFLQVDPHFVPDTASVYARTGVPHRRWLHRAFRRAKPFKRRLQRILPERVVHSVRDLRRDNLRRPPLPPDVYGRLLDEHRSEIRRLQEMIDQDLTVWLRHEDTQPDA